MAFCDGFSFFFFQRLAAGFVFCWLPESVVQTKQRHVRFPRQIFGAHGFNVKTVSPINIAHFLAQDFRHFLRVRLVGVLLFTP